MRGTKARTGPWRLRVLLLAPTIAILVLGLGGLNFAQNTWDVRQADAQISQSGTSKLLAVQSRLEAKGRELESQAQLLADFNDPTSPSHDNQGAVRALSSAMTQLGIGRAILYDNSGGRLLEVGSWEGYEESDVISWIALSGRSTHVICVDPRGLQVLASAPVMSGRKVIGAIVVCSPIGPTRLTEVRGAGNIELAVYSSGQFVETTAKQAELLAALQTSTPDIAPFDSFRAAIQKTQFRAEATDLGDGALLVALVPTRDQTIAFQQRLVVGVAGSLAVIVATLLAGLLVSRRVVGSLESMSAATRDMMRGNYRRRVSPSRIRELNEMSMAVNGLGRQLETQVAQLAHQAFYDSLSNLPNRTLFMDRLERAVSRSDRRGSPIAVMFVDIDNFKWINDSLGHTVGDELLKEFVERLNASIRHKDTAARLAGDELTILLEDISGLDDAVAVAERLAAQLEDPFYLDGHEVFVTVSIGIAISTPNRHRPEDLLREADFAMYRAKGNGKARFEVFDSSWNAYAAERLHLETDLRRAVERKEMEVYYQPIVDLWTGKIIEVEALARWNHPKRGVMMPDQFIPLAEETGLIVPLGQWVLEAACLQIRRWQQSLPGWDQLMLSVNISPKQFQSPVRLVESVARVLVESGLDCRRLKLEITESTLMSGGESAMATVNALKDLGVKLAVDDFGTGYSSLSCLKHFPIDVLKIDRTFVDKLGRNPEDTAIVRAIITLAKTLNMEVVGEGIETHQQILHLKLLGCGRGQGYYFSEPLSEERITRLLLSGKVFDESALGDDMPVMPTV